MKTSEQELTKKAFKTGFRSEIMEKVWHLMAILDGISVHRFLKDRLVLKGGMALGETNRSFMSKFNKAFYQSFFGQLLFVAIGRRSYT